VSELHQSEGPDTPQRSAPVASPAPPGSPMLSLLRLRWERLRDAVLSIPGARRFFRAALLLAHGFRGEAITLRASALTYLTLFSLVPLLAVVYSVVDLVSGEEQVRTAVMGWINAQLGIGAGAAIGVRLADLTNRASAKAVGGIGFAVLLFSALSLLWNIESAFNHIYGVRRPRAVLARLLKYWSFLTLGPVLLAGSLALSWRIAALQSGHAHDQEGHSEVLHILTALSSVAITYAALTLLYKVLPNAKVRLRAAFSAALVSGTLWEVAKFVFAWASTRMVQLHRIYGSLAVLPITLTWVYISWMIALVGCRLCFAFEESRKPAPHPLLQGAATREALCARVLLELGRQHQQRQMPIRAGWIARELEIDRRLAVETLRALSAGGRIAVETKDHGWLLGRDPSRITLAELRRAARSTLRFAKVDADPIALELTLAWEAADSAAAAQLGETVESFLRRVDPTSAAPASAASPAPALLGIPTKA
jgi:membrane protein